MVLVNDDRMVMAVYWVFGDALVCKVLDNADLSLASFWMCWLGHVGSFISYSERY